MSKANDKKTKALGMPIGTASNRLRKIILFALVCELKHNVCFQCEGDITSVDDLSIEHKEPWLQANNSVESFFSLSNIAFSHLSCNVAAGDKGKIHASQNDRCSAYKRRRRVRQTPEEKRVERRAHYERYGC